ncbi:hypothetical protein EDB84DRAFT_431248 [Lactarius hengduanensis]|nr:hypothetical protein EDB84DRAFT_431248 [Lactarius hengduanensis]
MRGLGCYGRCQRYWGLVLSLLLGITIRMGVCVTSALGCYWLISDGILHRLRLARRFFRVCSDSAVPPFSWCRNYSFSFPLCCLYGSG